MASADTPSVIENEITVDVQTCIKHLDDLHEPEPEHDGTNIVRNFR